METVGPDRTKYPLYMQLAPAVGVCVNEGWNRVWVNVERRADARWHAELEALGFFPVPCPANGYRRHAFYLARAHSPFTPAGADHVRSLLWLLCEAAYLITHPRLAAVENHM